MVSYGVWVGWGDNKVRKGIMDLMDIEKWSLRVEFLGGWNGVRRSWGGCEEF